jgi:hypothetical protein
VDEELSVASGPPATLTFRAKHPGMGPIVVYDEGHELTVEIQPLYHSHFSNADDAATFVADWLADRICIAVHFLGDRCLGASCTYLDDVDASAKTTWETSLGRNGGQFTEGQVRSERYIGSGPIPEKPM